MIFRGVLFCKKHKSITRPTPHKKTLLYVVSAYTSLIFCNLTVCALFTRCKSQTCCFIIVSFYSVDTCTVRIKVISLTRRRSVHYIVSLIGCFFSFTCHCNLCCFITVFCNMFFSCNFTAVFFRQEQDFSADEARESFCLS